MTDDEREIETRRCDFLAATALVMVPICAAVTIVELGWVGLNSIVAGGVSAWLLFSAVLWVERVTRRVRP